MKAYLTTDAADADPKQPSICCRERLATCFPFISLFIITTELSLLPRQNNTPIKWTNTKYRRIASYIRRNSFGSSPTKNCVASQKNVCIRGHKCHQESMKAGNVARRNVTFGAMLHRTMNRHEELDSRKLRGNFKGQCFSWNYWASLGDWRSLYSIRFHLVLEVLFILLRGFCGNCNVLRCWRFNFVGFGLETPRFALDPPSHGKTGIWTEELINKLKRWRYR